MAVTVHIPPALREHTAGAASVALDGAPATLSAALDALWRRHPGLRDRVLDERGTPRQHVALFVGTEHIRSTGGLATPLAADAEVTILPAVSGG